VEQSTTRAMPVLLTSDEFLRKGLQLAGFDWYRQTKVSKLTNIQRFKAYYGSNPVVYATIWEDLQLTMIPEARINTNDTDADSFLMGIYFLKSYPTETQLAGIFKVCERTGRKWAWYIARKIQALKGDKVSNLSLTAVCEGDDDDLPLPCLFMLC
jgi:hypothetical protein